MGVASRVAVGVMIAVLAWPAAAATPLLPIPVLVCQQSIGGAHPDPAAPRRRPRAPFMLDDVSGCLRGGHAATADALMAIEYPAS